MQQLSCAVAAVEVCIDTKSHYFFQIFLRHESTYYIVSHYSTYLLSWH